MSAERKGKFALTPPSDSHQWWEINDMEQMYAVVSIQSTFSWAENIIRLAWNNIAI